ncbi:amidohydrolase [Anaerococcus urinomassiliensis]|uniref:amidohydrolase n=1 Tax=Anaerococcus urinomassiliensis TaxID=1745712 RepID=UPI00093DCDE1|nr:amidohydrolase [Anaerococcus urinomassiliensis]
MKTLIKNTSILDMLSPDIIKGDIYIEDDKIIEVGSLEKFKADKVIDGTNFLTMPGFINCHTHVAMSYFRNYGNDTDLMTWINDYIFPAEENLNTDIVYNASLLSFAEMIKSGTTSFADMYFFEESTIMALEKGKLRAQISRGLSSPDSSDFRINENINLYKNFNGKEGRIEVALGPHAVYTTDKKYLKKIAEYAKRYKMPIHIHLSETKFENDQCMKKYGQSPTEVFDECGIFENRTIAAHGVYLSDKDIKILSEKNISIVHNPSSNLKLSSGILDVKRLMSAGINVCLGTDSAASNNKQSMLKEIELAALLAKYHSPDALKAFDILKMATINGAKALGLSDEIASIEKGKKADLIMLDLDNINHLPSNDILSSICYSTYEEDIKYVFIDGDLVLDNRKLIYLNEDQIKEKAKSLSRELI